MPHTFTDVVATEAELRDVLGYPAQRSVDKTLNAIDEHCRAFIARSPFVLIASSDHAGRMDISPKGDPAGFVRVLDARTLAIPDRPGNRRADTFRNILQNPNVALYFLIPGARETLRVSGTARLVRDGWLRESMSVRGRVPDLALVVAVDEAFLHCAKCIIRSDLWQPEAWPDLGGLPSLAQALKDQARPAESVAELQTLIDEAYRDKLY
jgi:PPOX class probable FMN-dependent enzyme